MQPWLRSARWDLTLLVGSVGVAFIPYTAYVLLGGSALDEASARGTVGYQARLIVNLAVTGLIAGPHMYATFTRTVMDPDYVKSHLRMIGVSTLIPIIVVAAAVTNYQSYVWLMTVFFGLASIHALHQIIWLTQAYHQRASVATSLSGRMVDYCVVFLSLYPVAVYKMVRGEFRIGPVSLEYNRLIYGWYWLAVLITIVFGVCLFFFVAKTIAEVRNGSVNVPKTALIAVAVPVMFLLPAFPNMDTSFQGANAWHSVQYLAITWYANRLRENATGKRLGFMHWLEGAKNVRSTIVSAVARLDGGAGWTTYYLLCFALVPVSGVLIVVARLIWPNLHAGNPGADEVYEYLAVLSVLLVHYFHDAFLFSDTRSVLPNDRARPVGSRGATEVSPALPPITG